MVGDEDYKKDCLRGISRLSKLMRKVLRYRFSMLVGSIDQSTTGTKFALFKPNGDQLLQVYRPHKQISLHEGWLEHNPEEILTNVEECVAEAVGKLGGHNYSLKDIKGIGICNQRETLVAWDSETGRSLNNAIVWCDTRTTQIAKKFQENHGSFKERTGLVASSYFSLFKMLWLLENNPEVKSRLEKGTLRFGTMDTWVVQKLTGKYVTDASNASRTFLYNLKGHWDLDLIKLAGLNLTCLPEVINSFVNVGEVKEGALKGVAIGCILGDQQSSAYAHNLQEHEIKCSYGTGCFLIMSLGKEPKVFDNFVTTILHKHNSQIEYGLEISIEAGAGIINWLKTLELFKNYDELDDLPDSRGVLFYPTFGSIFAPYWQSQMTGSLVGLGLHTSKPNILRAVLDSICFRIKDNINCEEMPKIVSFRADGGMTNNKKMMQFQTDLLDIPIKISKLDTVWGVAKGAMKGLGLVPEDEIESVVCEYKPSKEGNEKATNLY